MLEPLDPAIKLLSKRIDLLSDIDVLKGNLDWDGDGNVTLLDVIHKLHPGAATKFLDAVDGVYALVKSIPTGLDETMIDLGSFNFYDNSIDARQPGNSGWEVKKADVNNVLGALSEKAPGFVSLMTDAATFGGGGRDDGEGLQFPLLQDPKKAFGLLIGQDVNLFTFDMPTLRAGLKFDMYFPLLGVLGVKLRGIVHPDNTALEASAHLAFGYDTAGLREFAAHKYETDYLADLLDGFFVSSTDQPDGSGTNFVPQFQLDVGLGVFAAVNVLVLEAGVGGGIRGDVDFYLHDDDRDGKVRPKEIQNSLACGGPLYIFDVDASLTAGLWAYVAVGVNLPFVGFVGWRDDFNIASVTLAEWHTLRTSSRNLGPPPPVLAMLDDDGVLTLKVGPDQTFTVDHYDGLPGDERVYVSALGYTQPYGSLGNGVKEIKAQAGSNSTIIINPGVTANAKLTGQFGHNYLCYRGSGTAVLEAHGGGNELVGGAGSNTLRGDSGGDRLIGGTGTNLFCAARNVQVGGQGDTMIGGPGPGDSTMHGSNGRDHFVASRVTMCGGQGDVFSWTVGNGPATIIATPGEHSLLDVTGSGGDDTFVIGPDPKAGVIVNAKRGDDDPVTISASGIDTLSVAGRRGADRITFCDLAETSLRFIGVNRDELTVNDGSVDVTEIQGPSGGTSLLAGVVNTPCGL